MKELEERIYHIWLESNDNSFTEAIVQEVKDIAIEFGEKCFMDYADQDLSFSKLFDKFIKERYGKRTGV